MLVGVEVEDAVGVPLFVEVDVEVAVGVKVMLGGTGLLVAV